MEHGSPVNTCDAYSQEPALANFRGEGNPPRSFDAAQDRPFDAAQDRPFDAAQDRPFDAAQDRPFDAAQDRPFDAAQDRPFAAQRGELFYPLLGGVAHRAGVGSPGTPQPHNHPTP